MALDSFDDRTQPIKAGELVLAEADIAPVLEGKHDLDMLEGIPARLFTADEILGRADLATEDCGNDLADGLIDRLMLHRATHG